MGTTTVTRNFQITLPKDVRKRKNIRVGDELLVEAKEWGIVVRKLGKGDFKAAFGAWGKGESGAKTVRRIRVESEKRLKRLGL